MRRSSLGIHDFQMGELGFPCRLNSYGCVVLMIQLEFMIEILAWS